VNSGGKRSGEVVANVMRASADSPRLWLWLTAVLALAHAWVIFVSPVPPLHDYPAHLARIYIMTRLDDSNTLQSYYDYAWLLRHNIGADLIIFSLAHIMPIEVAGRLVVAAIPALTLAALWWVRTKVHGRCDSLVLLAAPYAMGVWLGWGFINYCLSVALALIAFAIWLDIRRWAIAPRSAALLLLGFVVWLAHLSGWGVLGLMVFAWEYVAAAERRGRGLRGAAVAVWDAAWRCVPLAAPLLAMALAGGGGGELGAGFSSWEDKLTAPLWSLALAWDRADKYCVALLVLLAGAALALRLTRISPGLALAAALIFAVFLVSPGELFGGGSVDVRLLTPFALVAATALTWRRDVRAPWAMAAIGLITIGMATVAVGRFAYTAAAFRHFDADIARNLALIEPMPHGARVLGIVVDGINGGRPPLTLLPSMAVVRRDAFSNLQWQADAGHTLTLLYPREGEPLAGGESTIVDFDAEGRSTGALDRLIAAEPLHRFDYVWIVNTHRAAPPADERLELVGATDRTALYRVITPARSD
jgi:hypothetical protein